MYQVRCPKCRKTMMYNSMSGKYPSKQAKLVKKCVYCNRSFVIHSNIVQRVEGRTLPNEKKKLILVTY